MRLHERQIFHLDNTTIKHLKYLLTSNVDSFHTRGTTTAIR